MKAIILTPREAATLAALAVFGLVVPNGIFLWYFFADHGVVRAALTNPVALVFISEAFLLMFLFAWLLRKAGSGKPTGFIFILLSLAGSLACSVPLTLWLMCRRETAAK